MVEMRGIAPLSAIHVPEISTSVVSEVFLNCFISLTNEAVPVKLSFRQVVFDRLPNPSLMYDALSLPQTKNEERF
jgi:hypothetical protein